jgi:hypothetical protein
MISDLGPIFPEAAALNITHDFQCAGPMAKVIFRIEEEAVPGQAAAPVN